MAGALLRRIHLSRLLLRMGWITSSCNSRERVVPPIFCAQKRDVLQQITGKKQQTCKHGKMIQDNQQTVDITLHRWQDEVPRPRRTSWCPGDVAPVGLKPDFSWVTGAKTQGIASPRVASPTLKVKGESAEGVKLAKHLKGKCRPCVFFASKRGCPNATCDFCHLTHGPAQNQRPKKQTRDAFKATVESVFEQEKAGQDSIASFPQCTQWNSMESAEKACFFWMVHCFEVFCETAWKKIFEHVLQLEMICNFGGS